MRSYDSITIRIDPARFLHAILVLSYTMMGLDANYTTINIIALLVCAVRRGVIDT